MHRLIAEELLRWKDGNRRKPLILRGARQVGKTWSVPELVFSDRPYADLPEQKITFMPLYSAYAATGGARIAE